MRFLAIPECFIQAGEASTPIRAFDTAIRKLDRLGDEISPYEKLNCVAEAFADIKSTIVLHFKGEVGSSKYTIEGAR